MAETAEDELWLVLGTYAGAVSVRAEPFEAVALNLAPLWNVPEAPAGE